MLTIGFTQSYCLVTVRNKKNTPLQV